MAYKRQIDRLPIVPADAKEHNVTCHYCIVGCGYKAYTWATNKQGGPCAVNCQNAGDIYSFHSGGANVLLADGSVHFLSANTTLDVVVMLTGRADGRVLPAGAID